MIKCPLKKSENPSDKMQMGQVAETVCMVLKRALFGVDG